MSKQAFSLIIKDAFNYGIRINAGVFRNHDLNYKFFNSEILGRTSSHGLNSSKLMSTLSCNIRNKDLFKLETIKQTVPLTLGITSQIRSLTVHHVNRPTPEANRKNLRFKVHFPEDGAYTIEKLRMSKLGGRDPETGRVIYGCIGGGHKRKYRWIDLKRVPVGRTEPLIERVLTVFRDPNRNAFIALVGHDDKLRYIIATINMKKEDLITSNPELPRNPIRPKEGDAHPVGALPMGTVVCCVEKFPGDGATLVKAAGTFATVSRKIKDKIILMLPSKREVAIDPKCIVTVGRVSNPEANTIPIGSPNRLRFLGFRPRSGLWKRKDGRYGRKIKRPPPVQTYKKRSKEGPVINLTLKSEMNYAPVIPSTLVR